MTSRESREQFFASLSSELDCGRLARRRILRELSHHLDDGVAELRASGLSAEAAEKEALRRLGDVETIASMFRSTGGEGRARWSGRALRSPAWIAVGAMTLVTMWAAELPGLRSPADAESDDRHAQLPLSGAGVPTGGEDERPAVPFPLAMTVLSRRRVRSIVELILTVAVAVGLALAIQAWIVKPYKIPSASMEPTLTEGQRVLVDRVFFSPHVGEIVVFHPPQGAENEQCGRPHNPAAACDWPNPESTETFIKRVVAGPGDVITIQDGHVVRNGKLEADAYTNKCTAGDTDCTFSKPIRIPKGMWFMMGDNRPESDDSRFWGPVPASWMVGDAFMTYWPPDRIGTL